MIAAGSWVCIGTHTGDIPRGAVGLVQELLENGKALVIMADQTVESGYYCYEEYSTNDLREMEGLRKVYDYATQFEEHARSH